MIENSTNPSPEPLLDPPAVNGDMKGPEASQSGSRKKLIEECKICIKSILAAYKNGADCGKIEKDYKAMVGEGIPVEEMGFKNSSAFLNSIPDTLKPMRDQKNNVFFVLANQENIEHIRNLVQNQKKSENPVSMPKKKAPAQVDPSPKKKAPAQVDPLPKKRNAASKSNLPASQAQAKINHKPPIIQGVFQTKRNDFATSKPLLQDLKASGLRPVVYLTKKASFSCAHRLDSPFLDPATNQTLFGKCNNPYGHGHNYKVEVTLRGPVDPVTGVLMNLTLLKKTIQEVINELDHKFIDKQVPYFSNSQIVSSVENIAVYIFEQIRQKLFDGNLLYSVKLHETDDNYAEYRGEFTSTKNQCI